MKSLILALLAAWAMALPSQAEYIGQGQATAEIIQPFAPTLAMTKTSFGTYASLGAVGLVREWTVSVAPVEGCQLSVTTESGKGAIVTWLSDWRFRVRLYRPTQVFITIDKE